MNVSCLNFVLVFVAVVCAVTFYCELFLVFCFCFLLEWWGHFQVTTAEWCLTLFFTLLCLSVIWWHTNGTQGLRLERVCSLKAQDYWSRTWCVRNKVIHNFVTNYTTARHRNTLGVLLYYLIFSPISWKSLKNATDDGLHYWLIYWFLSWLTD